MRSLRWVESCLAALTSNGFFDEAAMAAYRAYTSFLLDHLLLEVAPAAVPITPEDEPEGRTDTVETTTTTDTTGRGLVGRAMSPAPLPTRP